MRERDNQTLSWDRAPTLDVGRSHFDRYTYGVELYVASENLDVGFSRGARLLLRLTGDWQEKFGEAIELKDIRRSTGNGKDTREGMVAGEAFASFP